MTQYKQSNLLEADDVEHGTTYAFLHAHLRFCGAALFTLHNSRGDFIWRKWNHNIRMQKIAEKETMTAVKAPSKGVGACEMLFELSYKVHIYISHDQ